MVRLDVLVADVLANARRAMEERAGDEISKLVASKDAPGGMARGKGLGCEERHHRPFASHQRRLVKRDTGLPRGGLEK